MSKFMFTFSLEVQYLSCSHSAHNTFALTSTWTVCHYMGKQSNLSYIWKSNPDIQF